MAFCIYCGARIPDDARFCVSCGSSLEDIVYPQTDDVSESSVPSGAVSPKEKPERQSVKPGTIIAAVAGVLVIAFAVWLFAFSGICVFHRYSDATCTKPAICEKCGKTKGEALGHKKEYMDEVEPTCTEEGYTEGVECSRCGKVFDGRDEIPALGHDIVRDPAVLPTASSDGLTAGSHCARCGAVIERQEVWKASEDELTFLEAVKYIEDGDNTAAFKTLNAKKDSSCPQISWMLGNCYYLGKGVEKDHNLAYEYYCRGADAGYLPSLFGKSRLTRFGYGTSKDVPAANEMIKQVYDKFEETLPILFSDYERMQLSWDLATSAYFGQGIQMGISKAFEFLEYAGEYGSGEACLYLSGLYSKSKYVETDWDKAFYWAKAAAEAPFPSGIKSMPYSCLATMYKYGLGCEIDEKLSDEYKAQAISLGVPPGDSCRLFMFSDSSFGGSSWYYTPD